MDRQRVIDWLTCPDPSELFARADQVRREVHGDGVHLRAILELSNQCRCNCHYCGLRRSNLELPRFRLRPNEVEEAAEAAHAAGIGTLVLQSGEDVRRPPGEIAELILAVRGRCSQAITLSLGEWPHQDLALWRRAGADRYLLKFETSNPQLYQQLRPDRQLSDRLGCLYSLQQLGYQVGSGNMVGLPGQTIGDLAGDLLLIRDLDLDMVAIGPFLPHPATPLARAARRGADEQGATVDECSPAVATDLVDLTLRCIAAARLLSPRSHIPGTTALGTLVEGGRERALTVGANVLMENITPPAFRRHYQIYPERVCTDGLATETRRGLVTSLEAIGRFPLSGRGDAVRLGGLSVRVG